jgi:hypothetical protein
MLPFHERLRPFVTFLRPEKLRNGQKSERERTVNAP